MRVLAVLAASVATLVVVGACGSDDDDDAGNSAGDGADGGAVTAEYCAKYCSAQAAAGTLRGSKAECLADCCKDVKGGCPAEADVEDAGGAVGADAGPTCAVPCGDVCCGTREGCVISSGKPVCVRTCETAADCSTGCCAPATNVAGDPVGPYVCKPNDGKAYDCCNGTFTTCSDDKLCCVNDAKGNQFCALPCNSNTQCGAAHCVTGAPVTLSTCYFTGGKNSCGP